MALDGTAAEYAEGAVSQVAYRGGVWWHWRRPCAILGAWIPVAGRSAAPTPARVPMAPVAVMPGDAGGAR